MERRILSALIALLLLSVATAQAKPNPHADLDCLVCHQDQPRFGIDTHQTVTFADTTWDDPKLCYRCHKPEENLHPVLVIPGTGSLGTQVPVGLPLGDSSDLEKQVVCTTCHFIHAADTDFSLLRGFPGSQTPNQFRTWQDFCRACHGAGLGKRSPHAGDDKSCVFCHQNAPKKGQLVAVTPRGQALCAFCHQGGNDRHWLKTNPFGGEVTCDRCHDPHLGKESPGRLRPSFIEATRGRVTINPHYLRTLCFNCHREEKDQPLLTQDGVQLCNRCHGTPEVIGDIHPIGKPSPNRKIPSGWPLEKGQLTCLTCHRAGHAADKPFRKFLRGGPYKERQEFCFNCHAVDEFKNRNPHLDINAGKGCEFCHSVRPVPGKDNAKTIRLVANIVILCMRCHNEPPHPADAEHLLIPSEERMATIVDLPLVDGAITCATCHNPHVEDKVNHKLRTANGIEVCAHCHKY